MNRRVSTLRVSALCVLAGAIVCGACGAQLALASEVAEHAESAGSPVATLIFSAINLGLFLWVLSRYVLPAVRTWVSDRQSRIMNALAEAAAAKAEAQALRAQWERRLAELESTVAEMRAQARAETERERERILEAARNTAVTIRRDAERAAAYELRRTQEQLRGELVRQAVQLAEEATRTQWSPADQQRAVAEFVGQLTP